MKQSLLSVGIDIGTSTTQVVLSRLTLENRAGPFSVPKVVITGREPVYRSAIHRTPLLDAFTIDAQRVGEIVGEEYRRAGIRREEVETGAVIITGETARKENARQVLSALSEFAGDFVVTAAGPDLESILAGRGAGAQELSLTRRGRVLNFDVGGGTANLALFEGGQVTATGCYDIGGRLVRCGEEIEYVAPVLAGRFPGLARGLPARREVLEQAADEMAQVLAQAAGLCPPDGRMEHYATAGAAPPRVFSPDCITFSGGVADCLWSPVKDWQAYGDIGPLLGRAIRRAFAPAGERLVRGTETIRATVVGAGSYSTELSGSTIFYREVAFPLKSLPVVKLEAGEEGLPPEELGPLVARRLGWHADQGGQVQAALAMEGFQSPGYAQVAQLAEGLARGFLARGQAGAFPVVVVERDMAKVLGQALSQRLEGPLLCLDGVAAGPGDYLEGGVPVAGGQALPVVIKTLAFQG